MPPETKPAAEPQMETKPAGSPNRDVVHGVSGGIVDPREAPPPPKGANTKAAWQRKRAELTRKAIADMGKPEPAPAEPKAAKDPKAATPGENEENSPAEPKAAADPKAAKPEPAAEPEPESKAKAWEDLIARERKLTAERKAAKDEAEATKRDREELDRLRAEAQERDTLFKTDPIAWIKKYGGADFADKWVAAAQGKTVPAIDPEEIATSAVERAKAEILREIDGREARTRVDRYLDQHVAHWRADESAALLRGWYGDDEVRQVIEANADAAYRAEQKLLTESDLVGRLTDELRTRLERLSKSEAGRAMLRELLGEAASAPTPKPTAAAAPVTLSNDLATHGANTRRPQTRAEQVRQAMRDNGLL